MPSLRPPRVPSPRPARVQVTPYGMSGSIALIRCNHAKSTCTSSHCSHCSAMNTFFDAERLKNEARTFQCDFFLAIIISVTTGAQNPIVPTIAGCNCM